MGIKNRLKVMLFLQYFVWGSWFTTLGAYIIGTLHQDGSAVGYVFSSKGLASIIMPCLIGIIADKFISAKYLYMLCHGICAVALFYAASVTDIDLLYWMILINMFAFMPTIALSNSLSYFSLDKNNLDSTTVFPKVRVYGTIGFIAAMWTINLLDYKLSNAQLYVASGASVVLVLYAASLPYVPVIKKQSAKWTSRLGLDAFVLFKNRTMVVFFLFAMLLGVVLQITNMFGAAFLQDFNKVDAYKDSLVVNYSIILLSLSQMAEVGFILTIPFFLKRFGIKRVMIISMLAWTLRFGLFAFGDPSPIGFVLLILSMIAYGCAFDFFNISGSIFIEKEVNPNIRASAQGLFMTMVNGVGAYIGSIGSGKIIDMYTHNGVRDWQTIWLIFASYALVLAILFFFFFNYKPNDKVVTMPQ
ncbi:nucleoside permease [Orbaceae bacterium ac157xtp]